MAAHVSATQAAEFETPVPDFVPLLRKILEKTESGRIEWSGHPQDWSYSTVVRTDEGFYSVQIEDAGGMPAFAVRDETGRNVFEWSYELEDDPGLELADKLLKAAAANYVRRTNTKIKQLVDGIDKL
ncbi:MAG TPA: hypothetical protein VF170_04590 [Planctomycetaceae bacterium]